MSRETYVFRDGRFIEKRLAPPRRDASRADLPCPMIIRDGMDAMFSHADGKTYESKSAYYRAVKEAGCVIVGNDIESHMKPNYEGDTITAGEVGEAYRKVVHDGYKPAPLEAEESEYFLTVE